MPKNTLIQVTAELFNQLSFPFCTTIILYGSKVRGRYILNPKEFIRNFIYHVYTLLGRAPNVESLNAVGRLSLKLNMYLMILNFWTHFENLPVNSIFFNSKTVSQLNQQTKKTQSFMTRLIRLPNSQLTATFSAKNQLILTAIFWAIFSKQNQS